MNAKANDTCGISYKELQATLKDLRLIYGCFISVKLNSAKQNLIEELDYFLERNLACPVKFPGFFTMGSSDSRRPELFICGIDAEIEAYESGEDIAFYEPDELYPDENAIEIRVNIRMENFNSDCKLAEELLAKLLPRTENATKSEPFNYCVQLWSFVARNRVIILDYMRLVRNALRSAWRNDYSEGFYAMIELSGQMYEHINLYFTVGLIKQYKYQCNCFKPFLFDKSWDGSSQYSQVNQIKAKLEELSFFLQALQAVDELAGITS